MSLGVDPRLTMDRLHRKMYEDYVVNPKYPAGSKGFMKPKEGGEEPKDFSEFGEKPAGETDFSEFGNPSSEPVPLPPERPTEAPVAAPQPQRFGDWRDPVIDAARAVKPYADMITPAPAQLAQKGMDFAKRAYEGFTSEEPAKKAEPPKEDGQYELTKGAVGGWYQNAKMFGRSAEVWGRLLNQPGMVDIGNTLTEYGRKESEPYEARVPGIENIRTDTLGNFLQDVGSFAGYQTGQAAASSVPSFAGALTGQAIGGAVGTAAGGPPGAALGAKIGSIAGMSLPSYAQNLGDVGDDVAESKAINKLIAEGKVSQTTVDMTVAAAAVPMAMLDTYSEYQIFGKKFLEKAKGDLKRRLVSGIVNGAIVEGTTEGLQQVISEWAQEHLGGDKTAYQQMLSVVNNFLGGMFGGIIFGGAGSLAQGKGAPSPGTGVGAPAPPPGGPGHTGAPPGGAPPPGPAPAPAAGVPGPNWGARIAGMQPDEVNDLLRTRGYSDEDIAGMSPEQLHGELEEGLREGQGPKPGTRAAPVAPEDLASAGDTINGEPTAGQREQGNYQHIHTELPELGLTGRNGLSVETAAGGIRQGPIEPVSPEREAQINHAAATLGQMRQASVNARQDTTSIDQELAKLNAELKGKPAWTSPQMPVAYGRSKQIMGADSTAAKPQGLDFFIGNAPAGGNVYVVDQFDPKTGKFDEHKVMARFNTPMEAVQAYLGSYSDDASVRIGGMKPMTAEQFKQWTKSGKVAKKPVSDAGIARAAQKGGASTVAAPAGPAVNAEAPTTPTSSEGVGQGGQGQAVQQPHNVQPGVQVPTSDEAMKGIADLFGDNKAAPPELSTGSPQPATIPQESSQSEQPSTAKQDPEDQIEDALKAAGVDPGTAQPVVIHRAAQLMKANGWDPVAAFGAALVQLVYEHQQVSLENLYNAYGKDNVDAILQAGTALEHGVSAEETGPGPAWAHPADQAEPVRPGSEAGSPQGAEQSTGHPDTAAAEGAGEAPGHQPSVPEGAEQPAGEPVQESVPVKHEPAAEAAGASDVIPPELWTSLRNFTKAKTNEDVSTEVLGTFADMLEGVAPGENAADRAKVLENVKLLRAEIARREEPGEGETNEVALREQLAHFLAEVQLPIDSILPRDLQMTFEFMSEGIAPADALERAMIVGGLIDGSLKPSDPELAAIPPEVLDDLIGEAAARSGDEATAAGENAPETERETGRPNVGPGEGARQGTGTEHPTIGRPEGGAQQEHGDKEQQHAGPEPIREPAATGEQPAGAAEQPATGGERGSTGGPALLTAKAGDVIITNMNERIQITEAPHFNDVHKIYYAAGKRWIKTTEKWSGNTLIHNFKTFKVEPKAKIEDVGEKIEGARKHEWAGLGLSDEQIDKLNGAERAKHITKENIWPRPDYAGAVADGIPADVMYAVKRVYDRLPTAPFVGRGTKVEDAQNQYVQVLRAVREVFLKLVQKDTKLNDLDEAVPQVNKIIAGELRPGYSSEDFSAAMRRRNGRFNFTHPADVTYDDKQAAARAVTKGWPNLEPWQRSYFLHPNVHRKDGEITGKTWLLVQKNPQTVVSTHPTEDAAKEAARVAYENRKEETGDGDKMPKRPILDSVVRNGTDVREGKDVTADQLRDEFGFRGVQWGNYVTQDERQDLLNLGFDALHDLAGVLNISPKAVSLDGTLGAAFGARGRGGRAAAHYEPDQVVFNMTKKSGAGALAHEWAHALDHYLGELNTAAPYGGAPKGMSGWYNIKVDERSYAYRQLNGRNENLSPRLRRAASDLMQALHYQRESAEAATAADKTALEADKDLRKRWGEIIERAKAKIRTGTATSADRENLKRGNHNMPLFEQRIADREAAQITRGLKETSYYKEAQKLSGSGEYWIRPTEMFARALESYVFDKLAEKGVTSQYLVQGVEDSRFTADFKGNPFPAGDERKAINAAFDKLFAALTAAAGKLGEGTKLEGVQGTVEPEDMSIWKVDRPKAVDMVEEMKGLDESSQAATNKSLSDAFAEHLEDGSSFRTILEARQFAKNLGHSEDAKSVEEALEFAVVKAARRELASHGDPKQHYEELVDLYSRQPRLGTRTSTSVREQAYSTPIPLAYIASRLAGVTTDKTVLEPTAGNGALLIEASPNKTTTNEINDTRAKALREQGFNPKREDASEKSLRHAGYPVDIVLANPPFGAVKDNGTSKTFDMSDIQPGYRTNEIDHAIALRALASMKDNGRAVLILGGLNKLLTSQEARSDGYNGKAKREFFKALYDRYNVVDHFTVAGELYERQGAGWPTDVIVIDGRGKSARALPAVDVPRVYTSWDKLGGLLDEDAPRSAQGVRGGAVETVEGAPAERAGGEHGAVSEPAGRGGDRNGPASGEGPGGVREGSVQQPGAQPTSGERHPAETNTGGLSQPGRAGAEAAPGGRPSGLTQEDFGKAFDDYLGGEAVEKANFQSTSQEFLDIARKAFGKYKGGDEKSSRPESRDERVAREAAAVGYSVPKFKTWQESLAWMKERIKYYEALTKARHGAFDGLIFDEKNKRKTDLTDVAKLEPVIAADNRASHNHLMIANSTADVPGQEGVGRPYSGTIQGYHDHFEQLIDRLERHPTTKAQLDEARAKLTAKPASTSTAPDAFAKNVMAVVAKVPVGVDRLANMVPISSAWREYQKTFGEISNEEFKKKLVAAWDTGKIGFVTINSQPGMPIHARVGTAESQLSGKHAGSNGIDVDYRSTAEVAKATVTSGVDTAEAALAALSKLFIDPSKIGMGIGFDPETYAKAKPLFAKAAEKFGEFKDNLIELMKHMMAELETVYGLTRDAIARMRPYVIQFMQDVQSGAVNLFPQQQEQQKTETKPSMKKDTETENQVSYTPSSTGPGLGTLVPVNLKRATDEALTKLKERVGPLDKFVAWELGYDTHAEMWEGLGAEQVDGVAMMIDGLKRDPVAGSIIGDQTGIGKGRQVASIIRWAIRNDRVPVFFTAGPKLYVEMYDDMKQIGMQKMLGRNPRILVTNANLQLPLDRDDPSAKISTGAPKDHGQILIEHGNPEALKKNFDMVFTTYSQVQTLKGGETQRRNFMRRIAPNAVFIFDESHKAGGQGVQTRKPKGPVGRADLVRQLILAAGKRAIYSSATYAKRPDVMDLYAATDMGLAVENPKDLGPAIASGGVPMQQVVAAMLVEAGQYIRRERSFAGVKYESKTVDVDRDQYNDIAGSLMGIHHFSGFVKRVVKEIKRDMKSEGGTTRLDNAVGVEGAESTNFTSKLHNVIGQILLAMKAQPAIDEAVAALRRGEKPVIAVSNTMESFLQSYAEDEGIVVGKPMSASFNDVLQRNLDRSREIRIKKAFAEEAEKYYLTDDDLSKVPGAIDAYNRAKDVIAALALGDLPVSPIDFMRNGIVKAGYTVSEITGRGLTVDYGGDEPLLARRNSKELSIRGKEATRAGFVDGSIDVVILNQSGAEGLSLHASERFKDQRRRLMIIAQTEGNIDTHMQILGRIHRTGQVVTPNYMQLAAGIPAELRPMSILMKKMASLNANTTAARESAVTAKDVPDLMNEYGDEIAVQFVVDHPGMNEMLGNPVSFVEDEAEAEGAMRKLSGRIAMLPLTEQEDVWEYLIREYKNLLTSKEAAGENALEAKVIALKAVTLERTEVVAQKNASGSPFAAPVTIEKVRAVRIGRPYTAIEIAGRAAEAAGIETAAFPDRAAATFWLMDAENAWSQTGKEITKKQAEVTREAIGRFDDYKRHVLEEIEDPKRMEAEQTRLGLVQQKWARAMDQFRPGQRFTLKTSNGNLIAIALGVKQEGKPSNPLALSTWKAAFAIAESGRQVILPFSRVSFEPSDNMSVVEIGYRHGEDYRDTINWFEVMQGESKETRYIATGNMLAAYDWLERKGKITHYTDDQGHIRQGILTAKNFDLGKHAREHGRALETPELVDWLSKNKGRPLTDKNELVTIEQSYQGDSLYVSIIGNKKKAGFLFTDEKLTEAAGRDFVQNGRYYRATVPLSNISATLDRLAELQTKFSIPVTNLKTEKTERQAAAPDEGEQAMFFGRNAVTSRRLGTLAQAEELETNGATPRDIWRQTGWFRRKDGKWRIEADASKWTLRGNESIAPPKGTRKDIAEQISSVLHWNSSDLAKAIQYQERAVRSTLDRIKELDRRGTPHTTMHSELAYQRDVLEALKKTKVVRGLKEGRSQIDGKKTYHYSGPLSELLDAPNLYEAYPDLANIEINLGPASDLRGGSEYSPDKQSFKIESGTPGQILKTLVHEIQHAVQSVEGFSQGGSDATLHSRTSVALYDIDRQLEALPEGSNLRGQLEDMREQLTEQASWFGGSNMLAHTNQSYDSYMRLLGEVEARNAVLRKGLTASERAGSFPLETEDIPQSEQFAGSDLNYVRPTQKDVVRDLVEKAYPSLPNMIKKAAYDESLASGDLHHYPTEYFTLALTNVWSGDNAPTRISGLRSNFHQSLKFSPEGLVNGILVHGARNLLNFVNDVISYEISGPLFINDETGRLEPIKGEDHKPNVAALSRLTALRQMLSGMLQSHPELAQPSGYTVSEADPDKLIEKYQGQEWTYDQLNDMNNRILAAIRELGDKGIIKDADAMAYDFEAQSINTKYGIKDHPEFQKLYDANRALIDEYNAAYEYRVYRGLVKSAFLGQSYSIEPAKFPLRDEMQSEIQGIVNRALGPAVRVQFPDTINVTPTMRTAWGDVAPETVTASYLPADKVIKVVVGSGHERESAYHEVFHGFVQLYATPQEKELLKRETPRLRDRMAEIYGLTKEQASRVDDEEVQATVAAAYQMWRDGGETGAGSGLHIGLRQLLDRLWKFFQQVKNWAANRGFTSFEDLIERLYSGTIKRQRHQTVERGAAPVRPLYRPFVMPKPTIGTTDDSNIANDNEPGSVIKTRPGWTADRRNPLFREGPQTPMQHMLASASPLTFRQAEKLRQEQREMLDKVTRDKRHYMTDEENARYDGISERLRFARQHDAGPPSHHYGYPNEGGRFFGDVHTDWQWEEHKYERDGFHGWGDFEYATRIFERVTDGERSSEMGPSFGTLEAAQKWVETKVATGEDIRDQLFEEEAQTVRARKIELRRQHMHVAKRTEELAAAFPKTRQREVLKMFDALDDGPQNQIRYLPEGQMYVRKTYRDDLGGKSFEISRVDFKDGARGRGAFTEYLNLIEKEARARDYASIHVEQIGNPRLLTFLQKRGYQLVGNMIHGIENLPENLRTLLINHEQSVVKKLRGAEDERAAGLVGSHPERIVGATVVVDGRVFIGFNHAMALQAARDAGYQYEDYKDVINPPNNSTAIDGGYITSEGRVLADRTGKAADIAKAAGQRDVGPEWQAIDKKKGVLAEGLAINKDDVERFSSAWQGRPLSDFKGNAVRDWFRNLTGRQSLPSTEQAAGLTGGRPRSLPPNMSADLLKRLRYAYKQQTRAEESLAKVHQEINDWTDKQPREKGGGLAATPFAMAERRKNAERILNLAEQARANVLREMGPIGQNIADDQGEKAAGLVGGKMTRRGFLKGTSAAAITAATGKVPTIEANPFAAATPAIEEAFRANTQHMAAEYWHFFDIVSNTYLRMEGLEPDAARMDELREIVVEELERTAKNKAGEGSTLFQAAADLVRSGWTPTAAQIDAANKLANEGEGIEPSEMTKKMVEDMPLEEAAPANLPALAEPNDYMKGEGQPEGLIEHDARSARDRGERAAGLAGSGGAPSYPKRPFSVGVKTSEIRQALLSTWASAFQPEVLSDKALQADPLFARYRAARGQERDSILHQSESWWNYWNKRTDIERIVFLHAVETNVAPTDPTQYQMFLRFHAMLNRAFMEEQRWGSKAAYWEDYFPHVWTDVGAATAWVAEQVRQLGPTWFQKRRFYDTIQEGLAAGLRLASSNPVDILTHRLLSGADMRMRMQLIYDLKRLGFAWEASQGGKQLQRRGWIPVNAPDRQQWAIAPDMQYLWKNAVEAKGLWQKDGIVGKGFRGWMLLKNAYVPIKLILSLFHPLHVLHINQAQYLAMGIRELATGNLRAGVGSIGHGLLTLPTGGLIDFFHGRQAKKAWEKRKTAMTPGEAAMVKIMEDGGFTPQLSEEQRIGARRALAVAWQNAASDPVFALKLPWHAFRRTIEKIQAPIFEHWIPTLKAAAYLNEAASFFMRNPHILNDDTQYRQALRTIAKSIDNRFGEMFYGAVFQNAVFKHSMIGAFLSYGWNFGFLREFIGGALEAPGRIVGKVTGETQTKQTQRLASNKIPFVLAYTSTGLMLAGMLGWFLSGEPPDQWIDFIFPKLGGKNSDGSPRRLSTPMYTREVPMLKKHIEEEGGNVLAGTAAMIHNKLIIKPILDLITNRDYYGYEIRNSNDPAWKQLWQYAKYMGEDISNPISVLGAKRAADLSGQPFPHASLFDIATDKTKAEQFLKSLGAPGVVEAFAGFGPAPAYAEKSAIQNRIGHLYGQFVTPQLKPQERRDMAEEVRGLRTALLNAQAAGDTDKLQELRQRGRELGLSMTYMTSIGRVPTDVYLFSRLPDEQQESLIRQMSPEEKTRYMPKAHPKVRQKFNREAEAASAQ